MNQDTRLTYRMGPVEYARNWYQDKIDGFVAIGRSLEAEGVTGDKEIAHELHEWLNAPDSFFNWTTGEEESNEIIEAVLRVSPHANIATPDGEGVQWDEEDDSMWAYYAAHAFIADVMEELGRDIGPYGPDPA